jgi:hypothetical protein
MVTFPGPCGYVDVSSRAYLHNRSSRNTRASQFRGLILRHYSMTLASIPSTLCLSGIYWVVGHPAWSFVVLLAAVLLLGLVSGKLPLKLRPEYRWALAACSAGVLLLYAYVGVTYCPPPQFHDHTEPQTAAFSCLLLRGQPTYPGPDSAQQYALPYGPYSYLWVAGYYWLMGPSIFAAKLSGVISGLASVAIMLVALKRVASWWVALPCTALAATLYFRFELISLRCRSDSHELLLVSLGIFALTLCSPWIAALLMGFSAGVIINMKPNTFAFFIPIVLA